MDKHFQKRAFYDQTTIEFWDSVYDQNDYYGDCFRKRMEKALSWINGLELSTDAKILDIGCGTGRLISYIARNGFAAFGMDFSHGMLVKADTIYNHENERNLTFFQGDIEASPIETSSFDVIICLGVIAYLKSNHKAFNELTRVLKPGGILIVSFINKARLIKHLDFPLLIKSLIQKITKGNFFGRKRLSTKEFKSNAYYIPAIRRSLEQVGYEIIDSEAITLELFSFFGKEILPRNLGIKINHFIDQFSTVPFIGSFGGWYMFEAKKK